MYLFVCIAMRIDYGELWHFCDDPVCPDPIRSCQSGRLQSLNLARQF